MNRRIVLAAFTLVLCAPFQAWCADGPATQFNLTAPTLVPGGTLQPGTYSIRVMDHLQDRFIVGVEGKGGSNHMLFIAVPAKGLEKTGAAGAIRWGTAPDGREALRGFDFGRSGSSLEFVYPKDEAVALARANGSGVLAVDPASEGKSPELSQLSNDDMQMVTLWMLTPERVSGSAGGEAKIAASKYEGSVPGGVADARKRPPVLKTLPHTASSLPLVLLAGLLAAAGAGLLRMRRTTGAAHQIV